MQEPKTNGWTEWGKYVLKELERQEGCLQKLEAKQNKIREDIILLKAKAGLLGAGTGGGIVAIIELIRLLT